MGNRIDRMKKERNELKDKCEDLSKFIHLNPTFKTLVHDEQVRLIKQLGFMQAYLDVLDSRLFFANEPVLS